MYYVLFTTTLQRADTASGTVFQKKKNVQEFVVKTLAIYSCKEFLKIPFENWNSAQIFFTDFDHSYYNNSLKYAANRTLFSITTATRSTKSEVFLKDFFCKFEDISE